MTSVNGKTAFPGGLLRLALAAVLLAPVVAATGQDRPGPPTFRSGVRLIDVDVIATDREGRPVRDLSQDDFEIVEDGRPQEIRTFSIVDLPFDPPEGLAERRAVDVESDVVSNRVPEGRTYVLALDYQNGSMALRARHLAEQWLDEVVQYNDRVAVVHLQGTFSHAQAFTSSRRLILDAIDRLLTGAGAGGDVKIDRPDIRYLDTLQTLRQIAERLGSVAGRRKAIVWLGGDIDLHPHARLQVGDTGPPDPVAFSMGAILAAWQDAARAAVNNNVAIYPVDSLGLRGSSLVRAASFREVAEETNGLTVGVNTNTYSAGFAAIVQDASFYYLLGYSPEPEHTDGKFHPIQVRVKRPGVTVRARRGYYAPDPARAAASPDSSLPAGVSPAAAAALRRPVPSAGLGIDVFAAPFRGAGGDSSVLIGAHIQGGALDLERGRTLAVSYQVFDLEGRVATGAYKVFELNLEPARRTAGAQMGFRFLERVPLRPGRYELRLVAEQTDRALGSVLAHVEVPDYRQRLLMSGVALASQAAAQEIALIDAEDAVQRTLRAQPTARRSFRTGERLAAFVEVYTQAQRPGEDEGVSVTGSLAALGGGVVRRLAARDAAVRMLGVHAFRVDVPLADLAPGAYVLTLEARAAGRRDPPLVRKVPFSVEE